MAINYLTNFINKLEDTYQKSKGFEQALAQNESKDFFETEAYVKKLIEVRGKLRKKRIMKFADLIELLTDISKDTNITRLYSVEKAINFIDEFEEAKPLIIRLLKSIDKELRKYSKSEVFEKLGIKVKISRSNRHNTRARFKDIFGPGTDGKRDDTDAQLMYNSSNWGDRFPYWKLDMTINIPSIRITTTNRKSYDFEVPYNGILNFKFDLHAEKIDQWIISEVGNMQDHIDNVNKSMRTLFYENRLSGRSFVNDARFNMTDAMDTEGHGSFSRFRGNIHPYMSRRSVNSGNSSNRCFGDMQMDIQDALADIDIERLGILLHTWLSNYVVGHTTPLQDVNNFMLGGIKESWGTGVKNYRFPDTYQEICYHEVMTHVKRCDGIECMARSYCTPYLERKAEENEQVEFELNEINVMNRYSNWFNKFNTFSESLKSEIKSLFAASTNTVGGRRHIVFNESLHDYVIDEGYDNEELETMYFGNNDLEAFEHLYWYFIDLPELNVNAEFQEFVSEAESTQNEIESNEL
jgi:hypothetical protein